MASLHHGMVLDRVCRIPERRRAPEIATSCGEIYITMVQSKCGMVDRIDFFTSFGHGSGGDDRARLGITTKGPTLLITDLAIWKPDPASREFTVVSALEEAPEPTALDLKMLRNLKARTDTAHKRLRSADPRRPGTLWLECAFNAALN